MRWSLRPEKSCAGRRTDPPGPAGMMNCRIESGGVRATQGDHAPAKSSSRHACTEDALLCEELFHQLFNGRHRDLVVAGQAAMALRHDVAETGQITEAQQALGLPYAVALGNDVSGPSSEHRIG
jgi:hypothetical protein